MASMDSMVSTGRSLLRFSQCAGPSRFSTRHGARLRAPQEPLHHEGELATCRGLLECYRVFAGKTGIAVARAATVADRGVQRLYRQIAHAVRSDVLGDLLDSVARGDQLAARRRVDAVEARPACGGRADAQVHLPCAGI